MKYDRRYGDRTHRATDQPPLTFDQQGRDASAGWRAEYAHQDAHAAARTDGGTAAAEGSHTPAEDFDVPDTGDRVLDTDLDDPDPAIVVHVPGIVAREAYIGAADATVAELNPDHPANAPVVDVVYGGKLTAIKHGYSVERVLAEVRRGGIQSYTYPVTRVRGVEP
jgi:hypothetical protein